MKPVHQTGFGKPNGNCLQAALASILELDLTDVPAFHEHLSWANNDDRWISEEWVPFLKRHGLISVEVDADTYKRAGVRPKGWHMIAGPSPRGDYEHVVVAKDGEPVHDPHPQGNCELVKQDAYVIFLPVVEADDAD